MSHKKQKSLTYFFKTTSTSDNFKALNLANLLNINKKEKPSTNERSASPSSNASNNPKKSQLDSPALISTSPFDISF